MIRGKAAPHPPSGRKKLAMDGIVGLVSTSAELISFMVFQSGR